MNAAILICTIVSLLPYTLAAAVESPFVGSILAPMEGRVLSSGEIFPFTYQTRNWCEQDYTQFKVSLVHASDAPTFSDVTSSDGTLKNAIWDFGTFTIANFPGIPAQGISPPTTLTFPNDIGVESSDQLYLAVSDVFLSCPGHIVEEIGVTSVPITFSPQEPARR
ncbi:hypothetical protein K474DRAFT_1660330 [Panus rudis PR-1116 ss-1]|nr:hypothetical protein K474DRAFT_1660330 [Panus rudis PR-1116 ss-1]